MTSKERQDYLLLVANYDRMFLNRMSNACIKRCVDPFYQTEYLNYAEGNCLDRCATKFIQLFQVGCSELRGEFKNDEATHTKRVFYV